MQHLKRLLYSLTQQYGGPFVLYRLDREVMDFRTGQRTQVRRAYKMKGICMPLSEGQKFFYDIGYLAANKNFTYGMSVPVGSRILIVQGNKEILNTDYVSIGRERYQIQSLEKLPNNTGYYLVLSYMETPAPMVTEHKVSQSTLGLTQEAKCVLN